MIPEGAFEDLQSITHLWVPPAHLPRESERIAFLRLSITHQSCMHACLQRSWVQPALLRLQHAMAGRMGEKGLRGGRYSEMYGAPSDEGQAVAHDTCDRIPMQKYVFPRQISRSWRKWPAAGIRFCSSNWFELRILYTRVYICHADRFIAEGWFSNRIYSIRITGERVVAIFYRSNFLLSLFFFFCIIFKIVIPTILLFRINITSSLLLFNNFN